MRSFSELRRDPQDTPAVFWCDECGGEIYSRRAYAVIAQRRICLACEAELLARLLRIAEGREDA